MANQITGTIELISPIKQDKTFYSRELVLNARRYDPFTGEPTQDNFIQLEIKGQDRCKDFEQYKKGDVVNAYFILEGRKYQDKTTGETKFFTKISCYKIELRSSKPIQQAEVPKVEEQKETTSNENKLPF